MTNLIVFSKDTIDTLTPNRTLMTSAEPQTSREGKPQTERSGSVWPLHRAKQINHYKLFLKQHVNVISAPLQLPILSA